MKDKEKNGIMIAGIIVVIVAAIAIAVGFWGDKKGVEEGYATNDQDTGYTSSANNPGDGIAQENVSSENSIMDSSTGEVVPMPSSDPDTKQTTQSSRDTIYDSASGQEVPMPKSDPGY